MTLLLAPDRVKERRAAARGPLSALADSLSSDLAPLLMDGFTVPREKARLSRAGGRCADDATLLAFDPFAPRHHRCPRCGRIHEGEAHYLWWVMSYQLWLAERAVHGALLQLIRGDSVAGSLAESILDTYADAYVGYPNRDNVLGPTRLFFSTYLESIWLLQICLATDLLEAAGPQPSRGPRIRERIIEPSSTLIRSYDEGKSNRQVWNNAALLASSALLGSFPAAEATVWGPSGIVAHLAQGLLSDGTWYEGENYHLFAHRGLSYGVQIAERLELGLGEQFAAPFVARFQAGYAASFASALPDLTLPSRRDSQYAISVRQWRFAELCELGLGRAADPRLSGMLARLYEADIPRGEIGRAQSTAEVERNLPPSALTRADLGWRSLLLAHPESPAAASEPPASVLLEGQGLAILRRDEGRVYVALDYGHSGGGHGHPDRLNLQLAHGSVRWLDDMGTGSYVDPTLHWYRSTLAHNAPLIDGHSQARVHGRLLAFEDDGAEGWVDAEAAGIAPGVTVRRAVLATSGYVIDELEWRAHEAAVVDLPIHLDAEAIDSREWIPGSLAGGDGLEDGFGFVENAMVTAGRRGDALRLTASRDGRVVAGWVCVDAPHEWWCATAPGAPGKPPARFYLMRAHGAAGTVRTILDWSGAVRDVRVAENRVVVALHDGSIHTHGRRDRTWHVDVVESGMLRRLDLEGVKDANIETATKSKSTTPQRSRRHTIPFVPQGAPTTDTRRLSFSLGEKHYRRSELRWDEAGSPMARVSLVAIATRIHLGVEVRKDAAVTFAPPRVHNDLDNEDPDINSDGLQIHMAAAGPDSTVLTWLLVPMNGGSDVRIRRPADGPALEATWAPTDAGYIVRCVITITPAMATDGFDLDLIVNEISTDRERRRGQLVLSGSADEWVFLRGDRQERERLLHFVLAEEGES